MDTLHPTPLVSVPLGISTGWLFGQILAYIIEANYVPSIIQFAIPLIFTFLGFVMYMRVSDL